MKPPAVPTFPDRRAGHGAGRNRVPGRPGRQMDRVRSLGLLLVLLAITAGHGFAVEPASWPRFRGPNGSGIATGGSFPVVFGPGTNLLWRTPVPSGHSSPCIWGRFIFLTGYQQDRLTTFALHRDDGRELWRSGVPPTALETGGSRNGSPAASTPCTDGERVFVYFGSFGLLCYDFNGMELWRRPLPVPVTQHGAGTSPVVAGDRVILACDQDVESYLIAVEATTGRELWRVPRPGYRRGFSTPVLWPEVGPTLFVLPGTLRLDAYRLDDGGEQWRVWGLPNESVSSAVLGDGMIFAAGWTPGSGVRHMPEFQDLLGRGDQDHDGRLTREETPAGPGRNHFLYIDANKDGFIDGDEWIAMAQIFDSSRNALIAVQPDGSGDVTRSHVAWTADRGLPYCPTPLYYEGRLYLVKNGGLASCLDARTGRPFYLEERLGALGDFYASPIAANGRVLMVSQPGVAVVLQAGDRLEVLARNRLEESVMATPAVVEETLYLRTSGHLNAFAETARYPSSR